jgi:SAM-dependent methyltransferase
MNDESNFFGSAYTSYWAQRVAEGGDGTAVAGLEIARAVTATLLADHSAETFRTTLDVGCGYGRMFPVLADLSSEVHGLEIDPTAVELARTVGYESVEIGSATDIPHTSNTFSLLFVWAVFDAIAQARALFEFSRVLEVGGLLLLTGKNATYCTDDTKAVEAEAGAARKHFPNHFTDVPEMIRDLSNFGLTHEAILRFERRGDFGIQRILSTEAPEKPGQVRFYEFAMLLRKVSAPPALEQQSSNYPWDRSASYNFLGHPE